MNERELRGALRDAMAEVAPPHPVTADAALARAHRARRRRQANMAGVGVGVVVVALVAGAFTLNAPPTLLGGAAEPSPLPATSSSQSSGPTPTGGETDNAPKGSPQYANGEKLLAAVSTALPPGLVQAGSQQVKGAPSNPRTHEEIMAGPAKKWAYRAHEPVVRPGQSGVGELQVDVYSPGFGLPTDVCAIARNQSAADCVVTQVGGKSVGFVAHPGDGRLSSVAVYRYGDGTVVVLSQSLGIYGAGLPPLLQPPLTKEQLLNLVLTPGFKVS